MPAGNLRFGATAAAARRHGICEFENLFAAERFVQTAASPSRWDVVRNRGAKRSVNRSLNCSNFS
jgi:hypothetical protein